MPRRRFNWFAVWIFVVAFCIPLSCSVLLYLWERGWFGDTSMISPAFAYIVLYLGIGLLLLGIVALIAIPIYWFKHRNDPDPLVDELRAIRNRLPTHNNKQSGTTKCN